LYYNEKDIFELLLQKIDNLTYITPNGAEARFSMDENSGLYDVDLKYVKGALHKLADELELIEIVSEADVSHKDFVNSADAGDMQKFYYDKEYEFVIKINNREFGRYFNGYLEYHKGMINYNIEESPIAKSDNSNNSESVVIEYKNRELILNHIILLANPDFSSENDIVCEELFKNVGKVLTRKDLEEVLKQPLKKDLNKIAEQLGFKKDIRKVFLSVSKTSICLKTTSLSKEDLDNLNIKYLRL
jgi:hypothetical protein